MPDTEYHIWSQGYRTLKGQTLKTSILKSLTNTGYLVDNEYNNHNIIEKSKSLVQFRSSVRPRSLVLIFIAIRNTEMNKTSWIYVKLTMKKWTGILEHSVFSGLQDVVHTCHMDCILDIQKTSQLR